MDEAEVEIILLFSLTVIICKLNYFALNWSSGMAFSVYVAGNKVELADCCGCNSLK